MITTEDTAGLAEIFTTMVRPKSQNIPHNQIRIAFTPDEKVSKETQFFEIERFCVEWTNTVNDRSLG